MTVVIPAVRRVIPVAMTALAIRDLIAMTARSLFARGTIRSAKFLFPSPSSRSKSGLPPLYGRSTIRGAPIR